MSFARSIPVDRSVPGVRDLRLYGFAAVFSLGNLVAPMAVHSVPQGGLIFLPIFFFTLVAAARFGFAAGVLTGIASPLVNFALTGLPPSGELFTVLAQSILLATVICLFASRSGRVGVPALFLAAVSMQLAGFAIDLARGVSASVCLDALRLGIPGVALMVVGGYAVLRLLDRFAIGGSDSTAVR
jgi:hypothetical protein